MADLEFTVAMVGQQQAEKGLDALAKKSNEVVRAEKIREKATKDANAAAAKPVTAGGVSRALGKAGGALGPLGGLGEVANLGTALGPLAAAAVAVGAGFKLLSATLANETRLALERVQGRITEAQQERQARSMQGASGVGALASQGSNLLRLESLGPQFTALANQLTNPGKGRLAFGAPDTQAAILQASQGGRSVTEVQATVEAARRLATLTGDTLQQAVTSLQEFGRLGTDTGAIAAVLSQREKGRVTEADVMARERNIQASGLAQTIQQGRSLQAQTTLAEQGNIQFAAETLVQKLIETQNPLMTLQAEAFKENNIRLQALAEALDEKSPLGRLVDRLFMGREGIVSQYADAQRALAGGRTDPNGSIPIFGQ